MVVVWILINLAIWGAIWWFSRNKLNLQAAPRHGMRTEPRELYELRRMRSRSLNVPLSERTRPQRLEDIVGQEEGIRALRAAMCGPNPQHVIIYGPPGCGKTCAARLVLEEARKRPDSPFDENSKFVEVDATCVRFDERSIADPLIGSVHDPIYQGAGALGTQGVPQPKPGAVSRAHCGILFLDEIGELHPMQMNKLLKVLEDRKVFFESAYYSKDNTAIPPYIHDIFQNGLPADFRLIGATTRSPEEIPPALRSRCVELFFRELSPEELAGIAMNAAKRMGCEMTKSVADLCAQYCSSGRDTVNMVQLAGGAAREEGRVEITQADIEWVARVCRSSRRVESSIPEKAQVGVSIGLAVGGGGRGMAIEIECSVTKAAGNGSVEISGAIQTEEIELRTRRLRRKSTAQISAENVCSTFTKRFGVNCKEYDIRFNVPGGIPVDGPSAGIALAVALMSALCGKAPVEGIAFTGEVTANGSVRPVGGVSDKIHAAIAAGAKTVVIPEQNWEERFESLGINIVCASDIVDVMRAAFDIPKEAAITEGAPPFLITA